MFESLDIARDNIRRDTQGGKESGQHPMTLPWMRRLITRICAITPAIILIGLRGDSSVTDLLTLSQVVLAIQFPFAMFPLLAFAASKRRMGDQRIGRFLLVGGWTSCILITALDIYGLPGAVHDAIGVFTGR